MGILWSGNMNTTRRGFLKLAVVAGVATIVPFVAVPEEVKALEPKAMPPLPEGIPFMIREWTVTVPRARGFDVTLNLIGYRERMRINMDITMRLTAEEAHLMMSTVQSRDVIYLKPEDLYRSNTQLYELGPFKNITSVSSSMEYDEIEMSFLDGGTYRF
jgi:hypothetical protein